MSLCVYFVVFAFWFDWTTGPQSQMPFPGFDWLFLFLVDFHSCIVLHATWPHSARSRSLTTPPHSCASSCTSSIHADGHLRPQRSLGGAAQPSDKLLLPDLAPGSGQARRLSAGTASPLARLLLLCALMSTAICSSTPHLLSDLTRTLPLWVPLFTILHLILKKIVVMLRFIQS